MNSQLLIKLHVKKDVKNVIKQITLRRKFANLALIKLNGTTIVIEKNVYGGNAKNICGPLIKQLAVL